MARNLIIKRKGTNVIVATIAIKKGTSLSQLRKDLKRRSSKRFSFSVSSSKGTVRSITTQRPKTKRIKRRTKRRVVRKVRRKRKR